jgi:hypothetical protein
MTRLNTIAVALGTLVGAALIASPLSTAQAQSGHSLILAERSCLDRGLLPRTVPFETCVAHTALANDRDVCLSYGLDPHTLGYRQCVANQRAYYGMTTVEHRVMPKPTTVQTYRVRPIPWDPSYFEEYVVPTRVSYRR